MVGARILLFPLTLILIGCGFLDGEVHIVKVTPESGSEVLEGSTVTIEFNDAPENLTVSGTSRWEQHGNVVTLRLPYRPGIHSIYYSSERTILEFIVLQWPTGREILSYDLLRDESLSK
jgi:hypothetical protein